MTVFLVLRFVCQSIFCLGLLVRLLSYIRKPYQMAERIIKHFAIRKLHIYIFLTTNLACGLSAVDQEVLWSFSKLNNHLSSTVPSAADGLARRALAHNEVDAHYSKLHGQARRSNVDRRKYCQLSSTEDGCVFHTERPRRLTVSCDERRAVEKFSMFRV